MTHAETPQNIAAKRVKDLRKENKYRQQELADILKISLASMQKIEQNKMNLSLENAVNIADHFGVSIDWLTGRGEKNEAQYLLDMLSKIVNYKLRSQEFFDKKRTHDDDPLVSLQISCAFHNYLIGLAKAENILKSEDLPNAQEVYDGYIRGLKSRYLEDAAVMTDFKPSLLLVEKALINYDMKPEDRDD